jgi:hypothetical protein
MGPWVHMDMHSDFPLYLLNALFPCTPCFDFCFSWCQRRHAVGMWDLWRQCVRFVRRLEIPLAYMCSSCFFVMSIMPVTLLELVDPADPPIDTDLGWLIYGISSGWQSVPDVADEQVPPGQAFVSLVY